MQNTILDTEVTTIDGEVTSLQPYSGNVLLIVNVASKCGLTPQYEQLENLPPTGLQRSWFPLQSVSGPGAGQRRGNKNVLQYHLGRNFPDVQQN